MKRKLIRTCRAYDLPSPWGTRYARHRAQAKYRNEPYELSAQEFYDVWYSSGRHQEIGKTRGRYTLIRVDRSLPWSKGNCSVIQRSEHTRSALNSYWARGFAE